VDHFHGEMFGLAAKPVKCNGRDLGVEKMIGSYKSFIGWRQREILIVAFFVLFAVHVEYATAADAANTTAQSSSFEPHAIEVGRSGMNEIFKRRHAVRRFQTRTVSSEDLDSILAAADSAPSAGGLKSRAVLIITNDATKKQLVQAAYGQEFIAQAPVVIVFWALPSRSASKYGARGRELFALQDATIAASFAWLQAVSAGLGACWVGAFDDEAVRKIFQAKIGPDWRPIALLPVGYAAE
jgi:nitroreductase